MIPFDSVIGNRTGVRQTGFEVVAARRQVSGFTANPSPSSGAGKSGEKIASFDMNRRRMSASIISDFTSIAYGVSRGRRLFCGRSSFPPPTKQTLDRSRLVKGIICKDAECQNHPRYSRTSPPILLVQSTAKQHLADIDTETNNGNR